jgi:tetraacyldisaccharide 4'-kinase
VASIEAEPVTALADHTMPSPGDYARAARFEVDAWLTRARCAVKLPTMIGDAPVLALEHRVAVAPLIDRLSLD